MEAPTLKTLDEVEALAEEIMTAGGGGEYVFTRIDKETLVKISQSLLHQIAEMATDESDFALGLSALFITGVALGMRVVEDER